MNFLYDLLGRILEEGVNTFGPGIDQTAQRLRWAYDPRGMLLAATLLDAENVVLNQVLFAYNAFSQR